MAKRIRRTQILDAASGEILTDHRETVYYTSEAYINGEGYRLFSRKHIRLGKNWDRTLTLREWGWITKAAYTMDENNVLADMDTLARQFGVNRRRVFQIISTLRDVGAVAKLDGAYVLNPAIAFSGTYLSPTLYRLFRADLEKDVPQWAKALYEKEEPPDVDRRDK